MHILIYLSFNVPIDELSWLYQLPVVMLVSWFAGCSAELRRCGTERIIMNIGQHVEVINPGNVLHGEKATVTAHPESGQHETSTISGEPIVWIVFDTADERPTWFYVQLLKIVE